jgi:cytochrome c1
MRRVFLAFVAFVGFGAAIVSTAARAEDEVTLPDIKWSWDGVFGDFDQAQLKRGFQVYHDVCSNCHSLNLVSYRNLAALGFSGDEIAKFAAEKQVPDINDAGDPIKRPAKPADHFVPPFANEAIARGANGGALPPDLSIIVLAREGGSNYVYGILTGFQDPPPAGVKVPDGKYYNAVFPGHNISMPPPISDDVVTYTDGTKATKEQIAKDIVSFLTWAAEPELPMRHNLGIKVMIFLALLTVLLYAVKRKIWADVH